MKVYTYVSQFVHLHGEINIHLTYATFMIYQS